MVYRGHIENGMVVFDEPVLLSDGTHVCVEALEGKSAANRPGANNFWQEPTIEELTTRQGVRIDERFEEKLGQGKTLWDDDREFEQFLISIEQRRREGLRL